MKILVVTAFVLLAGAMPAHADTANASLSVPLLGTRGPASVYPSRITVTAPGGPNHFSTVYVALHAVTHPRIEDLAVLLVHNGTDKYLLLSNAGGNRPLRGTTITFSDNYFVNPIPDTQPASPAYDLGLPVKASNYGTPPVFPAPAPPGPYTPDVPINVDVNGTWDLYVIDTTDGNRGVIAGGWSLLYDTDVRVKSTQANVAMGLGAFPAPALVYPITFDLSAALPNATAQHVTIAIGLRHNHPDDVRLALQSPAGTTVILMANAGGATATPTGTVLTFDDDSPTSLPDEMPITPGGTYRPTAFGAQNLPAPAPPLPYAPTLAAFAGESIRGTWKLWAFDDTAGNPGTIEGQCLLIIGTEHFTGLTTTGPPLPSPSTQPFVRMQETATGISPLSTPYSVTWRVTNGGTFVDAGAFTVEPGSRTFSADVPLKYGTNQITIFLLSTWQDAVTTIYTVPVDEFTYSLAEGATGSFFDLDVALANPTDSNVTARLEFLPEDGPSKQITLPLAAGAPVTVPVETIIPAGAVSTIVHSPLAVPLAVERTMIWDDTGYGGHGGTAVAPATRWLFAEGSQGYFNTYVLLANDNTTPADITVNFLLEGGGVVTYPLTLNGKKRFTLFAGSVPQLVNQSFGIDITASQPIIAERSMYLPGARLFEGGHESAGVNETSRQWFLAEGATGSFFDCFVLLSNPNARTRTSRSPTCCRPARRSRRTSPSPRRAV